MHQEASARQLPPLENKETSPQLETTSPTISSPPLHPSMCGLVATKMRVKAGPGVMDPDGDTTPGQMVNLIMEEVTNSTC